MPGFTADDSLPDQRPDVSGTIGFWSAGAVELTLRREWVVTTLFMLLGIISHLSASQPKGGRDVS